MGRAPGSAWACGALVLIVLAGCGSSGSGVVRPPASTGAPVTPAASTPGSALPTSTSAEVHVNPTVSVTPSRGLADQATVHVQGAGFSPGEQLQVIQCADRGGATGPGDCNLSSMLSVSSDSGGRVSATLTVLRGPFGTNRVTCTAQQRCLVSVTQASLRPSEEADAPITFAP